MTLSKVRLNADASLGQQVVDAAAFGWVAELVLSGAATYRRTLTMLAAQAPDTTATVVSLLAGAATTGAVVYLRPFPGQSITLAHATGNLRLAGATDVVLDDNAPLVQLIYDADAGWRQVGGTGGGALLPNSYQVNGLGPIFIQTADRAVTSSGTLFGTGVGGLLIGEAVLAPGATVRVTMAGRLNGASPALQLMLGGVVLASATSSVSGSGTGWRLEALLTVRTTGTTGTVAAHGQVVFDSGTVVPLTASGAATVNLTQQAALDVSVALGSGSMTTTLALVEALLPSAVVYVGQVVRWCHQFDFTAGEQGWVAARNIDALLFAEYDPGVGWKRWPTFANSSDARRRVVGIATSTGMSFYVERIDVLCTRGTLNAPVNVRLRNGTTTISGTATATVNLEPFANGVSETPIVFNNIINESLSLQLGLDTNATNYDGHIIAVRFIGRGENPFGDTNCTGVWR